MTIDFMGRPEVAETVEGAFGETIKRKPATEDLEFLTEGATKLKTSKFAQAIVENM